MKQTDILKTISTELGTSDLKKINEILKNGPELKFKITGKSLGHLGFTGLIKNVSELGLKIYKANKVSLVRFEDIESFNKAKPKVERPVKAKDPLAKKTGSKVDADNFGDEDDDDFGDYEEEEVTVKKTKKKRIKPVGKSGSKFIPVKK